MSRAVDHLLQLIRQDPRLASVIGPGSQAFDLLIEEGSQAEAAAFGIFVERPNARSTAVSIPVPCDCLARFNKELKPRNGRIAMALQVTESLGLKARVLVATAKIDNTKRKPLPSVIASCCPWCGQRAVDEEA